MKKLLFILFCAGFMILSLAIPALADLNINAGYAQGTFEAAFEGNITDSYEDDLSLITISVTETFDKVWFKLDYNKGQTDGDKDIYLEELKMGYKFINNDQVRFDLVLTPYYNFNFNDVLDQTYTSIMVGAEFDWKISVKTLINFNLGIGVNPSIDDNSSHDLSFDKEKFYYYTASFSYYYTDGAYFSLGYRAIHMSYDYSSTSDNGEFKNDVSNYILAVNFKL